MSAGIDLTEHSMEAVSIGRLLETCVSQTNWYSSHPGEMYFMATHDVMVELSDQMINYYKNKRGTPIGATHRDESYMKFHQWLQCDALKNDDFIFKDPYFIGSSWTPLRKDGSTIDILIEVITDKDPVFTTLEEASGFLVGKLCQTFPGVTEVVTNRSKILFKTDSFKMSIRFELASKVPPISVMVTAAFNHYDQFFDNFSVVAFFLQSWFKTIRSRCAENEKIVVPGSTTINYLLIFFLEFYNMISLMFDPDGLYYKSFTSEFESDVTDPSMAPELFHYYKKVENLSHERKTNIGEVLTMFFYFYGYLIDLKSVILDIARGEYCNKMKPNCEVLVVHDSKMYYGHEVPDASRLQFLCRQAFQTIKDAGNPKTALDDLFALKYDSSFNLIRDHIVDECEQLKFIFQACKELIIDIEADLEGYDNPEEVNGFIRMTCGKQIRYRRTDSKNEIESQETIKPFSYEMHAAKICFGKLKMTESCDEKILEGCFKSGTEEMFTTKVFPNPNDFSELCVIFIPPIGPMKRLAPAIDYDMDALNGFGRQTVKNRGPTFFDMALAGCYKEIAEIQETRILWNQSQGGVLPTDVPPFSVDTTMLTMIDIKNMSQELELSRESNESGPKNSTEQMVRAPNSPEMFINNGVIKFSVFEEHVKELKKSWIEELEAEYTPNTSFYRMRDYYPNHIINSCDENRVFKTITCQNEANLVFLI